MSLSPSFHHQTHLAGSLPLELIQLYVEASQIHYPKHAARLEELGLFANDGQMNAAFALDDAVAARPGAFDIVTARHGDILTGFALGERLCDKAYGIHYLTSLDPAEDGKLLAEIMQHAPPEKARVTAATFDEGAAAFKAYGCAMAYRPARVAHAASRTITGEDFGANDTIENSPARLALLSDNDVFGWVLAIRSINPKKFPRPSKPA